MGENTPVTNREAIMRSAVRYAPVIAMALSMALVGCEQDPESPTAPPIVPTPALTADVVGAAGLALSGVTAGRASSCGLTSDGRAYCWGDNAFGEIGDGTTTGRLTPVAVAGGLHFRQLTAGFSTCGVTTDRLAYCWGQNLNGVLGDGTTAQRLTPVAVGGGHRFS